MKTIELVGHVDEQHRLHVELPADLQPGPVKVTLQAATGDEAEGDWRSLINQSWTKDWSDPREDIYTLKGEEANSECCVESPHAKSG